MAGEDSAPHPAGSRPHRRGRGGRNKYQLRSSSAAPNEGDVTCPEQTQGVPGRGRGRKRHHVRRRPKNTRTHESVTNNDLSSIHPLNQSLLASATVTDNSLPRLADQVVEASNSAPGSRQPPPASSAPTGSKAARSQPSQRPRLHAHSEPSQEMAINIPGFDPNKYGNPCRNQNRPQAGDCSNRPVISTASQQSRGTANTPFNIPSLISAAVTPSSQTSKPPSGGQGDSKIQPNNKTTKAEAKIDQTEIHDRSVDIKAAIAKVCQGAPRWNDNKSRPATHIHSGAQVGSQPRPRQQNRGRLRRKPRAYNAGLANNQNADRERLMLEEIEKERDAQIKAIGYRNLAKDVQVEVGLVALEIARRPVPPGYQVCPEFPDPHGPEDDAQGLGVPGIASGIQTGYSGEAVDNALPCGHEARGLATKSNKASNAGSRHGDSISAHAEPSVHGRNAKEELGANSDIFDWDGGFKNPVYPWHHRTPYNTHTTDYYDRLNKWLINTRAATAAEEHPVVLEKLVNPLTHPDGVDMVSRAYVLTKLDLPKYGYHPCVFDDLGGIFVYNEPADFETKIRCDYSRRENDHARYETTERLVLGWNANRTPSLAPVARPASAPGKVASRHVHQLIRPTAKNNYRACSSCSYTEKPWPKAPKVNIYLRPAAIGDIPQLVSMYNGHVEKGPRTCEAHPIDQNLMWVRYNNAVNHRLPFIVAVDRHTPKKGGGAKVVGFAVVQDWTGESFVDHISGEIELYVHRDWQRKGVGHCLMDRILQATDIDYRECLGYDFLCEQDRRQEYEAGGMRELAKLLFVIRHWATPERDQPEDADYHRWLKPWLESFDFVEEGLLKHVGGRHGR